MNATNEFPRERRLLEAMVVLADTLVNDYEVDELLHLLVISSMSILEMDAGAVMLADPDELLHLAAASSRNPQLVELLETQEKQGPAYDAFAACEQVMDEDLSTAEERWPRFASAADTLGLRAVYAFPLRLRDQCIGALTMFTAQPGAFAEADVRAAQALADVATIGILQQRRFIASEDLAAHLQIALDTRVVIEQAKGVVGHELAMDPNDGFHLMRAYARRRNLALREVARDVISGRIAPRELVKD